MITVFTPSYNRKNELKNLYNSLLNQNNNNFEWLIVDDGSTDNTKEYINDLKKDKKIKINYIYKKNGGKQSAYNMGLDKAQGDIFLCIDSDDILKENILSKVELDFKKINKENHIAGVMYIQGYINNKKEVIGTKFKEDNMIETYYNIYNKHKVTGDKLIVLKTEVAKEFYFPIIEGEKFVPEALIFNRISQKYKLLCKNTIAAYKEYLDNGYSNNYFSLVKRNPNGNALYYKEAYEFRTSLYNIYGYLLFSIYANKPLKNIIKEHPAKIKTTLAYIPVLIIAKIRK